MYARNNRLVLLTSQRLQQFQQHLLRCGSISCHGIGLQHGIVGSDVGWDRAAAIVQQLPGLIGVARTTQQQQHGVEIFNARGKAFDVGFG